MLKSRIIQENSVKNHFLQSRVVCYQGWSSEVSGMKKQK